MERTRSSREGEQPLPEDKLAATMRTIEEGITSIPESESFAMNFSAMSRFHQCSFGNMTHAAELR